MQQKHLLTVFFLTAVLLSGAAQATNYHDYIEYFAKPDQSLDVIDESDRAGRSVGIDGDIMVVGVPLEDSHATGVHTASVSQWQDDTATDAGAAYIYQRQDVGGVVSWQFSAYLKADNTDAGDQFGGAVAISGNTIVVSAPDEDSNQTTVGNNDFVLSPHMPSSDNSDSDSGAAYVFVRDHNGLWRQQAYLKAPDTLKLGSEAVAIDGDRIAISAVDKVLIFKRTYHTILSTPISYYAWAHEQTLSTGDSNDRFGAALAIDGNTLVVGAKHESSDGSSPADNSLSHSGAAYVYFYNGSSWALQQYVKAPNLDEEDEFGTSVALSGDHLAIGAPKEDSIGINAQNNSMRDAGAVYLFSRVGSGSSATWVANADSPYVKAPNPYVSNYFGGSVALDGRSLVVGAPDEQGEGGSAHDNYGVYNEANSGAVYTFSQRYNGITGQFEGEWVNMAYLKSPQVDADDTFGNAVDVSADRIAIGVMGEDSNSRDPSNNDLSNSGAAFVYEYDAEVILQPSSGYLVGGAVIGLPANTNIRLQNRQADGSSSTTIAYANYRRYYFHTPVTDTYDVSVVASTAPDGFNCRVENGSGNVNNGEVFNIWVVCYQPLISDSFESL